jgi:hypothetical protein
MPHLFQVILPAPWSRLMAALVSDGTVPSRSLHRPDLFGQLLDSHPAQALDRKRGADRHRPGHNAGPVMLAAPGGHHGFLLTPTSTGKRRCNLIPNR